MLLEQGRYGKNLRALIITCATERYKLCLGLNTCSESYLTQRNTSIAHNLHTGTF